MTKGPFLKSLIALAMSSSVLVLTGCGGDNDSNESLSATYKVTISNLTNAQPLSPPAVILHNEQYRLWQSNQPASIALEKLAEGGDNSDVITEADANSYVYGTSAAMAPIGPGASAELMVSTEKTDMLQLTIVSMLVNTNDAFTGRTGWEIDQLAVGQSYSMTSISYDAGTEGNSEAMGSIPGPADGGEGYNIERASDVNRVYSHPGVITMDDGLSTSVLTQAHKFDNPVSRITVMRMN